MSAIPDTELAPAGPSFARPMLIDQLAPEFDAVRREHLVVDAPLKAAYAAVWNADFVRAWRESTAVRALFATRSAAERVAAFVRGKQPAPPVDAAHWRLADMAGGDDWVLLGEEAPHEVAFGAIGRFWAVETTWEETDADVFATFDRPGFGKIACNFSLRPYGNGRTLVSYECRTTCTDEQSRLAFLRYWRPLEPLIGIVMRSQLRVIAA